jgi:ABC-2 type transport system permease protein
LTAIIGQGAKVGISVSASLFAAVALLTAVAMFMAVGMLTSQLAPTRHEANLIGGGAIAVAYLTRMVADSASALGWLRWCSPFGWIEELRPFTGSRPVALIPVMAFIAVAMAATMLQATRRDVGASVFARHDQHSARTRLLGGQAALTLRLTRARVLTWLVALGAAGLAFGLVTQAAGSAAKGSPTLERVIERLGGSRLGAVTYLGYVFIFAGALIAFAMAGQIAAIRAEESDGRLDNLLVQPVARWRWFGTRLGLAAALAVLAGGLTGVATWVGATSQGTDIGLGALVRAGFNAATPAMFVLGVGALVVGLRPRAAIGATYGLVVWSLLAETFAGISGASEWLRGTSPLLRIAPAPAAAPDWSAAGWLVVLGIAAAAIGVLTFTRRDLVRS